MIRVSHILRAFIHPVIYLLLSLFLLPTIPQHKTADLDPYTGWLCSLAMSK